MRYEAFDEAVRPAREPARGRGGDGAGGARRHLRAPHPPAPAAAGGAPASTTPAGGSRRPGSTRSTWRGSCSPGRRAAAARPGGRRRAGARSRCKTHEVIGGPGLGGAPHHAGSCRCTRPPSRCRRGACASWSTWPAPWPARRPERLPAWIRVAARGCRGRRTRWWPSTSPARAARRASGGAAWCWRSSLVLQLGLLAVRRRAGRAPARRPALARHGRAFRAPARRAALLAHGRRSAAPAAEIARDLAAHAARCGACCRARSARARRSSPPSRSARPSRPAPRPRCWCPPRRSPSSTCAPSTACWRPPAWRRCCSPGRMPARRARAAGDGAAHRHRPRSWWAPRRCCRRGSSSRASAWWWWTSSTASAWSSARRSPSGPRAGEGAAHLLYMTATPIPRTLALTAYGDLTVSTIRTRPPGRSPGRDALGARGGPRGRPTRRCAPSCAPAARPTSSARWWRRAPPRRPGRPPPRPSGCAPGPFAAFSVGPRHGAQGPEEKRAAMLDFAEGRTDLLVATTVVEVGIDVANATVILIEDADRFGLAQLHQLRGRVGRGEHPGLCLLFGEPATEDGARRLEALTQTDRRLPAGRARPGDPRGGQHPGPAPGRAHRPALRPPLARPPGAGGGPPRGPAAAARRPAPERPEHAPAARRRAASASTRCRGCWTRERIVAGTHRGRRIARPRRHGDAAHGRPRARGALLDRRAGRGAGRARPLRGLGRPRPGGALAGGRARPCSWSATPRAVAVASAPTLESLGPGGPRAGGARATGAPPWPAERAAGRPLRVVPLDPPYSLTDRVVAGARRALAPLMAPSGTVVIEHSAASPPLQPSGLEIASRIDRTYGDTAVSVLRLAAPR